MNKSNNSPICERILSLVLLVLFLCIPARSKTSIYVFDPNQSSIVQTGGISYVHWTYLVNGQFGLSVDPNAGNASFINVDANAIDNSLFMRTLDSNHVFNMTSLVGTVIDNTTLNFTGKSSDESDILITVNIQDDLAYLVGQTTPPPNSADFYIFSINAVAKRKYSGGTGGPNDPYQIAAADDLIALGNEPNDYGKHFILTSDIDLDPNLSGGKVFGRAVIAPDSDEAKDWFQGTPFTGVLDGNDHTISSLTITGGSYLGLFGQLAWNGEIRNLKIVDTNIIGSGDYICGLVGDNIGTVTQCYSTGAVIGNDYVGGLVGYDWGTVIRCYSTGAVDGNDFVGGLAGGIQGTVTQCYSTGAVSGNNNIGGLTGANYNIVIQCYSTGAVSGNSNVGGLVGFKNYGTVTGSFWDIQTSGQVNSAGGTGKTTAEMKDPNMFLAARWDFVGEIQNGTHEVWQIPEEGGYLILAVFKDYVPPQLKGKGTSMDPYLITDAMELGAMIYYSSYANYRLTDSIDLSGIYWCTGVIPSFYGSFDGDGHTISNLTMIGDGYLGLFSHIYGGEIKNLGVVDVNIVDSYCVGGLAGYNEGTVIRCYSSGVVSGTQGVGGLIGYNEGTVIQCSSSSVAGGSGWNIGGLIGDNVGTVTQCYCTGPVSGKENVGGLIGENEYYGTVTQCYSKGAVGGTKYVGGLIGENSGTVIRCYSTGVISGTGSGVGGFVGRNWHTVTGSFWDMQTSGKTTSSGGTGKTTSQMKNKSTFTEAGWDFIGETTNGTDDIWWISEGQYYPQLWWE